MFSGTDYKGLTFYGNWAEQLYSVQPLPSCATVSLTSLLIKAFTTIIPKHTLSLGLQTKVHAPNSSK